MDVVIIRYHGSKPWEFDPFYNANPGEVESRFSYYGITSGPALFVDGEQIESTCLLENVRDVVDERLSILSPIKIVASDSIEADTGFVNIAIIGETQPPPDSLVLRAAVIEDSIYYVAPNGQTIFNGVFRKFLNGPDGFPLEITQGDTVRMNLGFGVDPGWEASNLSVIVFVQDESNKSVLEAASSRDRQRGWARYISSSQGEVERLGYAVDFSSTLLNRGADTDTFQVELYADMPEDWSAGFAIVGGNAFGNSVALEPDSSCTINVTIHCGYIPGTGEVTVRAISGNDPLFSRSLGFFAVAGICGLLVDDDGGDSLETYFEGALDSLGIVYGRWDRGIALPETSDLSLVDFVIWFTGSHAPTLKDCDRQILASYLAGSGRLFITGQDIGYGLCDIISEEHTEESQNFYETYLHASYVQSNSNLFELNGRAGDPITDGLTLTIEGGDGADNQSFPDVIDSIAPARIILDYSDPIKHGGIRFESDSSKVVYLSFGFEAISNATDRITLLSRILNWFGNLSGTSVDSVRPPIVVYPNPASRYSMVRMKPAFGRGEIGIYDPTGRLLKKALIDGYQTYTWDLTDSFGRRVAPGVYFVRVGSGSRWWRAKIVILE